MFPDHTDGDVSDLEKDVLERNAGAFDGPPPARGGSTNLEDRVAERSAGAFGGAAPTAGEENDDTPNSLFAGGSPEDVSFMPTAEDFDDEPDINAAENASMAYDQLRGDATAAAGAAKKGYRKGRSASKQTSRHVRGAVSKAKEKLSNISRDDGGDE